MSTFHKGREQDRVLDSSLPLHQKMILICYIKHADAEGRAWPGIARIAALSSMSHRSAKTHRTALIDSGLIVVEDRTHGESLRVKVDLSDIEVVQELHQCRSCTSAGAAPGVVQELHGGSAGAARGVVQELHPNIHSQATQESTQESTHSLSDKPDPVKSRKDEKLHELWRWMNQARSESHPGKHRPMKLSSGRKSKLNARVRDWSDEQVRTAWLWWWTDPSERCQDLRGRWPVDTFLVKENHDKYQGESEAAILKAEDAAEQKEREAIEHEAARIAWEAAEAERVEKARAHREANPKPQRCSWSEYQAHVKAQKAAELAAEEEPEEPEEVDPRIEEHLNGYDSLDLGPDCPF